jgi:hypothetical protein
MTPLTVFLSKLIGLFSLLLAGALIVHPQESIVVVSALVFNRPVMFLFGMIALGVGIAMVLAHNRWSGGALTIVVTVISWIVLIRALFVLFLPPQAIEASFDSLRFEEFFYYYAAIPFLLGLYLTVMGFGVRKG